MPEYDNIYDTVIVNQYQSDIMAVQVILPWK